MSQDLIIKPKSKSLSDKIKDIDKFESLLDNSEELLENYDLTPVSNNDIKDFNIDMEKVPDIINLENLVQDFKYVRKTLRETTDNGRRILQNVMMQLLDDKVKDPSALILSFSELNKAITDNMKLYVQSYKDISTIILNLDKVKKEKPKDDKKQNVTNNLIISTADLIKTLTK